MKKKILIPGGKYDDMYLANAAKKQGLYVITSGYDETAPAHRVSDQYICADYSDQEAMLKIATQEKIDYMCSCANDRGMLSTAYVCEALGLPGHDSYETALKIHKKNRFEKLAEEIGLSTPRSVSFSKEEDAVHFLESIDKKMIIKPADGCAGRGISEILPGDDAREAVKNAFSNSLTDIIVIEPFIEGQLHSASVYLIDQKAVFCFIEEGIVKPTNRYGVAAALSPAKDKAKIEKALIREFEKVASALNLVNGKMHTNFIVDEKGDIYILEMHRRCSGDTYSRFIEASTGVKWSEWIVKAEMGLDVKDFPKWTPQKENVMYQVLVPPKNGIVRDVVLDNWITDHLIYSTEERKKGSLIADCRVDFAGILAMRFDSYEEMRHTAEHIQDHVDILMED